MTGNGDKKGRGFALAGIGAGAGAVLLSLTSMNLGAAFAKTLFPLVGAYGIAALRIDLAAILLLLFRRPWRRPIPRDVRWHLLAYGATLGLMNLTIYQAFARIPLGIAMAIEVTGPLAIVLFGSRRPRDFLWLGAAVAGLLLLLPLRADAPLDPLGVAFAAAAAACWALYILTGKRLSGALGGDAVAWGMLVAAILVMPVGLAHAGAALFSPWVLLIGIAIALLSSALPYSLEMEAMRRLSAPVFGLMLSSAPAIGALAGFIVLGERLTGMQWIAIACIVAASGGSALTAGHKPAIEDAPQ
ncbi:EamA family transporter [Sphingobium lactosutens]|uniref:EamA family transporter n=1 Tax=Sphingobium lactosutens TaxID=522773 RepID=UPI001C4B22D4|nr:EamA family transporter [Sphingobium lactosutens]NWK95226.1 EamA family transporter [Sphingobium lactosutens]